MERLTALNKLNDIAFSYFVSQSFAAACTVGLFDALPDYRSCEDLAASLGIHPDPCARLLAAMENLELVTQRGGQYKLSALGSFVSRSHEAPIRLIQSDSFFYRLWEFLPSALTERSPRFQQAWGSSAGEIYAAIFADKARFEQFFELMSSYAVPIGELLADVIDWGGRTCVLDVAGGAGALLIELAKRHSTLRGVVLELPPVCPVATQRITAAGLADRLRAEPGDMLSASYPEGVDVVLLSWVLHNYGDDKCKQLLAKAYDALPVGGRLVVSEKVLNNDRSGSRWGVMMSLQMLVACEPGAKERTEAEYRSLLGGAGFVDIDVIRLDAPRDVIVARKRERRAQAST